MLSEVFAPGIHATGVWLKTEWKYNMNQHEKLNYVEFPARDLTATMTFFAQVSGWKFDEYGPDYCAFSDQGLDGGFYRSSLCSNTATGSALMVFYSDDLDATQKKLKPQAARL